MADSHGCRSKGDIFCCLRKQSTNGSGTKWSRKIYYIWKFGIWEGFLSSTDEFICLIQKCPTIRFGGIGLLLLDLYIWDQYKPSEKIALLLNFWRGNGTVIYQGTRSISNVIQKLLFPDPSMPGPTTRRTSWSRKNFFLIPLGIRKKKGTCASPQIRFWRFL